MPIAPKSVCRCGGLVSDGVCSKCGPKKERWRSQNERPHNNVRWQKKSKSYRNEHPFCEDCLENGLTTEVEQVHHKVKVSNQDERFYDDDNLRSLCGSCHSKRTRRGE